MNKKSEFDYMRWFNNVIFVTALIILFIIVSRVVNINNSDYNSESCVFQVGEVYFSDSSNPQTDSKYISISLKNISTNCLKMIEVEQ